MLVQPTLDERAGRTHRQTLGSNVVESEPCQGTAEAPAAEGCEDLGMGHDDDVSLASEFSESGELSVEVSFVA